LGDALFVAVSDTQSIYAFNRKSGCLYWQRNLGSNLRSALSLGKLADGRPVLAIGDEAGGVAVVEARGGAVVWHKNVGVDRFSTITGPISVRGDIIYVPQSTTETIATVDPKYECCRASGAVSANRLSDGHRLWIHRIVREPVRRGKSNAEALRRDIGDRLTLVRLDHASHAILPEQPKAVTALLVAFFDGGRDVLSLQKLVDGNLRNSANR
jgi:hypothetical protein